MANATSVSAIHRKHLTTALIEAALLVIRDQGPAGYAGVVYEMFSAEGVNLGPNADAFRDWIIGTKGWKKRYDAAIVLHEARKAGLDPNHPELVRQRRLLAQGNAEIAKLRQQIKQEDSDRTVFEEVQATLHEFVAPIPLVPYREKKGSAKAHPVDMVAQLTDEHADEVITAPTTWGLERYNFDVFCLRLEVWQRLIIEYATAKHLPNHRVERLHIFKTGDALHGNIHGDKHRNHFGNSMRAAIAVADAEAEAIAGILEHVPYVNLVGVNGNHPRTTVKKDYADPHDNFDFLVMALIQARLAHYIAAGRLDVHAPRAWSAFVDVRGKVFALNHGDDVKGTWGIPWYGFSKKEARVQSLVGRKGVHADFFMYGHFHTDMAVTENGSRSIHGAAFTMTDGFALNAVNAGGEPMQPVLLIDDHPGMRSRIVDLPIWVRHPETERRYWEGKHIPRLGRVSALSVLGNADLTAEKGKFPLIRARK